MAESRMWVLEIEPQSCEELPVLTTEPPLTYINVCVHPGADLMIVFIPAYIFSVIQEFTHHFSFPAFYS